MCSPPLMNWHSGQTSADATTLQAVARHSKDFSGLEVDWKTETMLTAGATEALAAAFLAFINPGDEVPTATPEIPTPRCRSTGEHLSAPFVALNQHKIKTSAPISDVSIHPLR